MVFLIPELMVACSGTGIACGSGLGFCCCPTQLQAVLAQQWGLFPACPDCGVNVIQQSESEDQKVSQASHSSHGIIMSQFWTGIGGTSK